jgi:hypothetical protein
MERLGGLLKSYRRAADGWDEYFYCTGLFMENVLRFYYQWTGKMGG